MFDSQMVLKSDCCGPGAKQQHWKNSPKRHAFLSKKLTAQHGNVHLKEHARKLKCRYIYITDINQPFRNGEHTNYLMIIWRMVFMALLYPHNKVIFCAEFWRRAHSIPPAPRGSDAPWALGRRCGPLRIPGNCYLSSNPMDFNESFRILKWVGTLAPYNEAVFWGEDSLSPEKIGLKIQKIFRRILTKTIIPWTHIHLGTII